MENNSDKEEGEKPPEVTNDTPDLPLIQVKVKPNTRKPYVRTEARKASLDKANTLRKEYKEMREKDSDLLKKVGQKRELIISEVDDFFNAKIAAINNPSYSNLDTALIKEPSKMSDKLELVPRKKNSKHGVLQESGEESGVDSESSSGRKVGQEKAQRQRVQTKRKGSQGGTKGQKRGQKGSKKGGKSGRGSGSESGSESSGGGSESESEEVETDVDIPIQTKKQLRQQQQQRKRKQQQQRSTQKQRKTRPPPSPSSSEVEESDSSEDEYEYVKRKKTKRAKTVAYEQHEEETPNKQTQQYRRPAFGTGRWGY